MRTRTWLILGAAAGAGAWYLHNRGRDVVVERCARSLPEDTPYNVQIKEVRDCAKGAGVVSTIILGLKQVTG